MFVAKLLTRNAQSCFFLGNHKLLGAALIINLLFSLQKGLNKRGECAPFFALLRWPKKARSSM